MKIKLTLTLSCIMLLTSMTVLANSLSPNKTDNSEVYNSVYYENTNPIYDNNSQEFYEYKAIYEQNMNMAESIINMSSLGYINQTFSSFITSYGPYEDGYNSIPIRDANPYKQSLYITNDINNPAPITIKIVDYEGNLIYDEHTIQPGETLKTDPLPACKPLPSNHSHEILVKSDNPAWYIINISTEDPQIYE